MAELFHFVRYGEEGLSASPLCADWQHNQAWTTVPAVVTCPACAGLLKWVKLVEAERGPPVRSAERAPQAARGLNPTSIRGPGLGTPSDRGRAAPVVDPASAALEPARRPALERARPG